MAGSSPPVLDRRTLNRTLLARQHLLARGDLPPAALIEHLVGQQAQEPGDPYVGLWSRIADFDPLALSRLLEARLVVRIGLMRTTIHLVTMDDALAVEPVTDAIQRRVFRSTPFAEALRGLDPAPVLAAAREALEADPLTPSDLGRRLAEHWPERDPTALAALARYHLPLVQVPPRGLWRRSGRTTNTTLGAWSGRSPRAADVSELVRRYLRAFGPASVADIRTWSGLTGLRPVVDGMRPTLRTYLDERGHELLDAKDGEIVPASAQAPVRFLPQYDNVFLAHADRARISGALSWGIDFAWKGLVLVDGVISAAWRVRRAKGTATMTIELGRDLQTSERADLEAEADRLATFLDPDLHRALEIVVPRPSAAAD